MLPEKLWRDWEPRVAFPAFAGMFNSYEFTIQPGLELRSLKNLLYPIYLLRSKEITLRDACVRYLQLLRGPRIAFRTYRLNAQGGFIEELIPSAPITTSETYIFQHDLREAKADEMILFVGTRGRMDKFFTSPGSMTARYSAEHGIAGYRTGFMARPLNAGKGHYGFTGLNPATTNNPHIRMGILLINHSSNPAYNQSAAPVVRLHRTKNDYIERSFGMIAPHGFLEIDLETVFPELAAMKENHGPFWFVTECKGTTLASFHTYRNMQHQLLAIEHSRPSHAHILDYWKAKKK